MTAHVPETYGNIGPWQRYVEREHAARDAYLAVVQGAHREYLTGPWPDREAYQHVEQSAWMTYYAAGREAWRAYTRELAVPARQHPYPDPLPSPQQPIPPSHPGDSWWPSMPTFTEHERSEP